MNRLIVTKHEDTAWTLPDETGGSGADAEGLWTVEERPGCRPLDPEDPETTASEANMEPRWSVELQRPTGASSNPPERETREKKHMPATHSSFEKAHPSP